MSRAGSATDLPPGTPSLSKVVVSKSTVDATAGVDDPAGPDGSPPRPVTRRLSIRFVFGEDAEDAEDTGPAAIMSNGSSTATDDEPNPQPEAAEDWAEGALLDDSSVIGGHERVSFSAASGDSSLGPHMVPAGEPPLQEAKRLSGISVMVSEHDDADELPAAQPVAAAAEDGDEDGDTDGDGDDGSVAVPSIAARDAAAAAVAAAAEATHLNVQTAPAPQEMEDVNVVAARDRSSATFSKLSAQLSQDGFHDSDDESVSESPVDAPEGAGAWSEWNKNAEESPATDGAGTDAIPRSMSRRM